MSDRTNVSWKQVLFGMFVVGMIALVVRPSAFDTPPPKPKPIIKVVTKAKIVEKVRTVHLPDGKPPDGYMSRNDCYHIPEAMKINEVMYRFGWPAGENGRAMGLGSADYPIREDHGARCHVSFPYGTVQQRDLPLRPRRLRGIRDMARYKLMGRTIQGQEENAVPLSRDEQVREVPLTVVYQTDDYVEAQAIVNAGGFYRDRDNFIAVETVIDSQETPSLRSSSQPFPQKGN